jgi:hypothetical protein
MVTSSSDEAWTGCADIFSGRTNPCWVVEESVVQKLLDLWIRMEPHPQPAPTPLKLGYRGCHLKGPENRVWFVYGPVVSLTQNDKVESRHDPDRLFEKILLTSAPEGEVPDSFRGDHFL